MTEQRPAIIYYSRTGNTERVATDLAGQLSNPKVLKIQPVTDRTYPNWLVRSFVPHSTVPIRPVETDVREYDPVFLGTPKWTLSCPPFTAYLSKLRITDVQTGLFVTYGGFDRERYVNSLSNRLKAKDANLVSSLSVKRSAIGTIQYFSGLERFLDQFDL